MIMEDSGVESEAQVSGSFKEIQETSNEIDDCLRTKPREHIDDYDVIFRDIKPHKGYKHCQQNATVQSCDRQEEEAKTNRINRNQQPANTCRILQRKLELKVERAKRIYSQYQEDSVQKSQAAHLIPISCLPIPGNLEKKPLVDYKSDDSDDAEEISFFSKVNKKQRHPELSDTFSIQDMTIESDPEWDESGLQNLELLPPTAKKNFIDKLFSCFNCKSLSL